VLRAASTNFNSLKGTAFGDDRERWNSVLKLLHFNGCHIDGNGRGAKLVCDEGYIDTESEWQISYARHRDAVASCAGFINTKWDVDKEDDDPDGRYSSYLWPADDRLGRVTVEKLRDTQGRLFVRLVVRSQ
jgi:hypothetical protein